MSNIVRFDPFRELDRLQSEVNRLFEGFNAADGRPAGAGGGSLAPYAAARAWSPAVDVAETENEIALHVELPGMKQDDIDIELTGDTLTLRGERKFENDEKKDNFVRVERSYGRFQRSFTLGVPVQPDKVTATYKDGVLEIRLPKSEETKPRKVAVTTAPSASNGAEPRPVEAKK